MSGIVEVSLNGLPQSGFAAIEEASDSAERSDAQRDRLMRDPGASLSEMTLRAWRGARTVPARGFEGLQTVSRTFSARGAPALYYHIR